MKKVGLREFFCVCAILFIGTGLPANASTILENTTEQATNALIILDSSDISSMKQSREYIESIGGRIKHIYPPHILKGYVPENISEDVVKDKNVVGIHYTPIDSSTVEKYGETAVFAYAQRDRPPYRQNNYRNFGKLPAKRWHDSYSQGIARIYWKEGHKKADLMSANKGEFSHDAGLDLRMR